MGAVISFVATVAFGQPPVSVIVLVAAVLGAVGANLLWAGAVLAWSYLAAPAQMDHEIRAELERQPPAQAAEDLIRVFDAHIDKGRPLGRNLAALVRASRNAPQGSDPEIAEALYAVRDWIREGLDLVKEHCISRRQDYLPVWRAIPSALRQGNDIIPASDYAKRGAANQWVTKGTDALRQCIALLESRRI